MGGLFARPARAGKIENAPGLQIALA